MVRPIATAIAPPKTNNILILLYPVLGVKLYCEVEKLISLLRENPQNLD